MGSMTHSQGLFPLRSSPSSPNRPWAGYCFAIRLAKKSWAHRSCWVTRSVYSPLLPGLHLLFLPQPPQLAAALQQQLPDKTGLRLPVNHTGYHPCLQSRCGTAPPPPVRR